MLLYMFVQAIHMSLVNILSNLFGAAVSDGIIIRIVILEIGLNLFINILIQHWYFVSNGTNPFLESNSASYDVIPM